MPSINTSSPVIDDVKVPEDDSMSVAAICSQSIGAYRKVMSAMAGPLSFPNMVEQRHATPLHKTGSRRTSADHEWRE